MDDVDIKAVHFSRVATKHTRHTIASIRRLRTLASSRYNSTEEQRRAILDALNAEVDALGEVLFPDPELETEQPFEV